jgi:hypothetical protein
MTDDAQNHHGTYTMKRIQVSEKVFAAIWSLSKPGVTTENEILESLLESQKGRAPVTDRPNAANEFPRCAGRNLLASAPP